MSKTHYKLQFSGQITDDFSVNQVKDNLCKLMKKDRSVINRLFDNLPYTLAETTDEKRIERLSKRLGELGAKTTIDSWVDNESTLSNLEPITVMSATAKVRHLSGLTERIQSPESKEQSPREIWKRRMRYRFDTFMARGGMSIFKVLTAVFVLTFLVIALARGVFLYFAPEVALQHSDAGFWGNVYITFLEITDPGNMAQDISSSGWYKVFAVLAGISGIIMLSALIAFITTTLDQKISDLKRGRSKVIETGHTLVLGWNEQRIVEVLRELVLANESEDDGCVVILAEKDKEEMDDALRLRVKERLSTRFVTRSGSEILGSSLRITHLFNHSQKCTMR